MPVYLEQVIEAKKRGSYDAPRVADDVKMSESINDLTLTVLDGTEPLYEYDTTFIDDTPLVYVGDAINLPIGGEDQSLQPVIDYDAVDLL